MLVQFSVENFLSFEENTVFNLLATNDESHPSHKAGQEATSGKKLLRTAAIYGANASGKSNLIKSVAFARNLILVGTEPNRRIPRIPFKLSVLKNEPSRFQFVFICEGKQFTYGFKFNDTEVLEEYLFENQGKKLVKYFERMTTETGITETLFGIGLKRHDRKRAPYLKFKAQDTHSNQLLLTTLIESALIEIEQTLSPIKNWFLNTLVIIGPDATCNNLLRTTHFSDDLKRFMQIFLIAAGTGVNKVETIDSEINLEKDLYWLTPEQLVTLRRVLDASNGSVHGATSVKSETEIIDPLGNKLLIHEDVNGKVFATIFVFQHEGATESESFLLNEESDGTQRMTQLIPVLFDANVGRNKVVLIDELDRKFHPEMTRFFLKTFLKTYQSNPESSQLIFTTHDTNLLDTELLRRDEIWFIQKDRLGRSQLYSLAEFKIRPDLQLEKGYLNGRFGALPFIGDLSKLGLDEKKRELANA